MGCVISLAAYRPFKVIDTRTKAVVSSHCSLADALVAHDSLEWGWHIIRCEGPVKITIAA